MRIYYLFLIKKDYVRIYRKNGLVLYRTLENLFHLKEYDFSYGLSIYEQLCQTFAVTVLQNYIGGRFVVKPIGKKAMQIHSVIETTILEINPSCVIIKTNRNFPDIFKIFHIYNRHIFVCDFKNGDYFWLSEQIQKRSQLLSGESIH